MKEESIKCLERFFSFLTDKQKEQFLRLPSLYESWNEKINVISRKDIGNLFSHHILHSLSIGKVCPFVAGTKILDLGTGGGFPGIPLAILFPDCQFRLIDGTGKKILVATEVAKAIGLKNVEALHRRGEDEKDKFDFIVSRAVMPLPDMVKIVRKNISHEQRNALPNGIITLKGGNLEDELKPYRKIVQVTPISGFFNEEWFKEKNIVYMPL